MQCPKCGYVLTPFEVDCPRCKIFDWLVSVPPEAPTDGSQNAAAGNDADGPAVSPSIPLAVELEGEDKKPATALISCPLCQHPVSPRALQCPNCGHPMTPASPSLGVLKPEVMKPVIAAKPDAAIQPVAAKNPVALVPPVRELLPPIQRVVPVSPPSRPSVTPAAAVPQAAAPRELPLAPAGELRPEPQSLHEARTSYKPLAFVAITLAVVTLSLWLILSLSKAGRNHSAEASPQLTRASQLILQADADAARFQQTDLTPDQAAASLQTRTTQYQEVQRICQAAFLSGVDRVTASRDQQAATSGLHQVQTDTEAQSARLLTAEIGASIALYKRQTLTDAQAAQIRAKLRTDSEAALADCADALKEDPANAVAWASRVRALRFMGEAKAADAALARALTLVPGSPILLTQGGAPK